MTQTRRRPGSEARATSTTATVANTILAADSAVDRALIGQDASIWQALFDGQFRLAVKCDVCGRWLTASSSKRAHRGPRCAAKAVI